MKRFTSFFVVCIALLWGVSSNAWGESITVANGTSTNEYHPIYGYYVDDATQHNQVLYTTREFSSQLSAMSGKYITKLTFHSSTASSTWGAALRVNVGLAEVSASSLSGFNTEKTPTNVYSGNISASGNTMEIELSEPFEYNGGNLLLDIKITTKGSYQHFYFYGIGTYDYVYGYKSDGSGARSSYFVPKTTFTYEAPPTCPKPSVTLDDKDDESATFSWTAGGSETQWQYLCLPAATTITDAHWASSTLTSGTSAHIDGLSGSTSYKFYVRAYCDASDQSKSAVVSFTTDCGVIRNLPWNSDAAFAATTTNYAIPECWSRAITSYYSNPGMMSSGSYMQFSGNNNKTNKDKNMAIIVLPKFTIDIKNLKLTIEYSTTSTGDGYPQFFLGYILESEMSDATKFHSLQTLPKTSGVGTYTTSTPFTLSGATSGARVAICYNNQTTTSTSSSVTSREGRIKKIIVEAVQDCNTPQSVTCTGTTGTTASFSWTARAGVPTYQYCVVARGAAADWSGNLTTNTNSCTATGLSASTNYDFYVKCVCGGGVAGPVQFTTDAACPSVTGVTLSNKVFNGVTVNWTTSSSTDCDVRYKAGSGAWTSAGTNISGTSKAITGFSVGTTYTFEVKPSCSADGWVAAGETYTPTCPAVGALTLSGQKYNGVTVGWSAVAGISTYNLRYRKGSDAWTTVNDIAALTYTIASGLVTNQAYTIQVQTECGSTWSSTTYTPIAEAPTVAGANSITETSISAVCTDMSGNGATGHQYILVARGAAEDWSSPNALNPAGTSVTGLTLGTDYDLYVRAVYGGIYSASTKKQFTTVVNKPTGLTRGTLTSTSVQFSWTAGGGATQYQYLCLPSGTTPTESHWSSSTLTSLTSVTVEDLTPNTSYIFHVRAYYNGKVSTRVYSAAFSTPCGTEDIPYSANFNSNATKPACWTCDRWSSTAGYWYTYLVEGTNYGLRYYGNNSSQTADIQTPPIYLSDKADLTFKYSNNYSSHPIPSSVIISNGVTTKTVNLPTTASGTLTSYTIDLSNVSGTNFTGTIVTITFRGAASSYASYSYFRLDDVAITAKPCTLPTVKTPTVTSNTATVTWTDSRAEEWSVRYRTKNVGEWTVVSGLTSKTYTMTGLISETEYEVQVQNDCGSVSSGWTTSKYFIPTCPTPSGLSASNITSSSATLSWTVSAGKLRYKIGDGSWTTVNVSGTSHNLTGLSAETTYAVQVQADCAADDSEKWSSDFEFTTKCAPKTITKIAPYEADFSGLSGTMPDCWEKSVTTYPYVTGEALTFSGNTADQTAILPAFTNDASTLTLEFGYRNRWASSGYGQVQPGYINSVGTFVAVGEPLAIAFHTTDYTPVSIEMPAAASTAQNIAIRMVNNTENSSSELYVKDVRVILTPTCFAPATVNDATSITLTGATITWTASGRGESYWEYACVPSGDTPDWSEATKVNVHTATLTGLTADTSYDFYVRSWCAADDQSESVMTSFATACGARELDYIETFGSTSGVKPTCWTCANWGESTNGYWYTYEILYGSDYGARLYATSAGLTGDLTTPAIILSEPAKLSFKYSNNYDNHPMTAVVIISNGVTTKEIELPLTASGVLDSHYEDHPINLANVDGTDFTGSTITITFRGTSTTSGTAYFNLDDVAVKIDKTWIFTGAAGDSLWSTKGNWDKGILKNRVPNIDEDVIIRKPATVDIEHAVAKSIVIDQYGTSTGKITIPALKGLEVAGTITRTTNGANRLTTGAEDLVLESSASGNASLIFSNSNGNSASVAMYSKGNIDYTDPEKPKGIKNYQYIGVPVSEANALYNYYGSWLYSWSDKGSGYGWQKVPTGGSVYAWTGYCITQETPKVYSISGTLVPTTYQDIEVPAGENMVIGNSWTAPIDISTLNTETDMENLAGNIYFFNTGVDKTGDAGETGSGAGTRYAGSTYLTVPVNSAKYMADNHINSMQGFFVKNTSESEGTLHLNYDSHVRSTTRGSIIGDAMHAPRRAVAESNDPVVLWLTVVGEHYDDRLLLLERKDFSYGFDNGWDGDKWDGNESVLYLYTLDSEGTENSVSAVPDFEGTIVGFRAGADNAYTMYFEYLNSDATLYLFDTETNSYTRIENGGSYWFTTQDREKHQRFIITRSNGLETPTGVEPTSDSSLKGRAKKLLINDKMYILLNGKLYDATGKAVR